MGLKVIEGGKGNFVCPWCGATFTRRFTDNAAGLMSLEDHWRVSPRCGNNRNVNSQTQEKYTVHEPSEE